MEIYYRVIGDAELTEITDPCRLEENYVHDLKGEGLYRWYEFMFVVDCNPIWYSKREG